MRLDHFGLAATVGLILLGSPCAAATFVVDPVDLTADSDAAPGDGTCATASGPCTLRAATEEANALAGADTLILPTGLYVTRATLQLDAPVEVIGAGACRTTIDGYWFDGRLLSIAGPGTVSITGVTIAGGSLMFLERGSQIRSQDADLTLRDCELERSQLHDSYGDVDVTGGSLLVERCVVRNDWGSYEPGFFVDAPLTLIDSELPDWSSIHASAHPVAARNSTFHLVLEAGATASADVEGGSLHATVNGGTLFVRDATCGIEVTGGDASIERSTIRSASVTGGSLHVTDSVFRPESATRLLVASGGTAWCERSSFVGGRIAGAGGAVLVRDTADVRFDDCTFVRNESATEGGAMRVEGGRARIAGCTIARNTAATGGGVSIAAPGVLESRLTVIAGNTGGSAPDVEGTMTSGGHVFVGDAAGATVGGDLTGVILGGDPRLTFPVELSEGATAVAIPLPGSPLLDAAPAAACLDSSGAPLLQDQRGVTRPQLGGCDVGAVETCAGATDTDRDGVGDACDPCPLAADDQRDTDGDGIGDACDPCPLLAVAVGSDGDGDGVDDACDDCPFAPDPLQSDCDGDTVGDACEPGDADGDGVSDACDACPSVADDQSDADGDLVGDACDLCPQFSCFLRWRFDILDGDGDGVGDDCDNCPFTPNPGQENLGGARAGDACDPDCAPILTFTLSVPAPGFVELSWTSLGDRFDVYRGSLAALIGGSYDHSDFGACNLWQTSVLLYDTAAASYYVVAARCAGGPGALGTDSLGNPVPGPLQECP